MRVVLGFVIAPLTPGLLATAIFTPLQSSLSAGERTFFMLTQFSPLFAVPATVLFAVPLFLWFRRRHELRLRHVLIGSVMVSAAAALTCAIANFAIAFDAVDSLLELLKYLLLFVPYGLFMALIFWLVAFWKRKAAV